MKNLIAAMLKFQEKCPVVPFDKKNPHFDSRFATMTAIHRTIQPLLTECGLVVMQPACAEEGKAGCTTLILHESGEMMEHTLLLPVAKDDPQKACASITYARRYALSAALGLITDEDTDGEAAVSRNKVVANAGNGRRRAPAMKKEYREKLKHAAAMVVDERGAAVNPDAVIRDAADALGYSSPIEMKDKDFEPALTFIQGFETGAAE